MTPLHGGDLSEVFRVSMDGHSLVAKRGALTSVEARMLQTMAQAGAPVPQVIAHGQGWLVMEDLGQDTALDWSALGTGLRALHSATAAECGWPEDYAFGPVEIQNAPLPDWPQFYGQRRLLPSLPHLPADIARRIEALAASLPDRLERSRPSLLHGDLWMGNIHSAVSGPAFIDPACYYGAPEVDLAMLGLFGDPSPAFWKAYGRAPLTAEETGLYQLWPALVHYRLFGAGYKGLVLRCLAACGA
jgi:fructosamine-3-kinase